MKKITKNFGFMSIVLGMFLMNSCTFSTLEGDDIAAYAVELSLHEYIVECVAPDDDLCTDDIRSTNEGFWISLEESNFSYEVSYDGVLTESGSITRTQGELGNLEQLIPISDAICSIMPNEISIDLSPNDQEKTDLNIAISLVKKQN